MSLLGDPIQYDAYVHKSRATYENTARDHESRIAELERLESRCEINLKKEKQRIKKAEEIYYQFLKDHPGERMKSYEKEKSVMEQKLREQRLKLKTMLNECVALEDERRRQQTMLAGARAALREIEQTM
jgi:predicted  nucleic acid-binding Zn-ribbon protein